MRVLSRVPHSRAPRLVTALAVLWFGWTGTPSAQAGDAVLVGAGDIASCRSSGDAATAALIKSISGTVFTLGDNAYPDATWKQFAACYGPTWGRVKSRTRPAIGNHEYETRRAAAYWDFFGSAAGPKGKGWYSYNAGDWHVIVLNANCSKVGCRKGSEQERWLRAELAKHDNKCTLAYWHQSRFSSGRQHGNESDLIPFWDALYDYGADVVLSGHSHIYERFAPQTPWGKADPDHGIRQFVVGSGGASHDRLGSARANSQIRNGNTFGVLKLTLKSGSYDWQFIPQKGKSFRDSGHGSCHGRP